MFITKMPTIRIEDLADAMIETLAPLYGYLPESIQVEIIGTKPGEKMYEELMNLEETRRAWELGRYFVVLPAFTSLHRDAAYAYATILSKTVTNPYHSGNETPLSKFELLAFLEENNLMDQDTSHRDHPAERYWPNGGCIEPFHMVRV